MKKKITREIIHKGLEFRSLFDDSVLYYDDFCKEINRYKHTLLNHGAKKGDLVAVVSRSMLAKDMAQLFACMELGLILVTADMPTSKLALPYCKLNLIGPPRFTFFTMPDHEELRPLFFDMWKTYGGKHITDFSDDTSDVEPPWEVNPEDKVMASSTSGTTDWSKTAYYEHWQLWDWAHRNGKGMFFEEEDCHIHLKNMHHAGTLLIVMLPSLVASKYHVGGVMPGHQHMTKPNGKQLREEVHSYASDIYEKIFAFADKYRLNMLSYRSTTPTHFIKAVGDRVFENGFKLLCIATPYDADFDFWAKEHGVQPVSVYGSNYPTMMPFTTLRYDGTGKHKPNVVGTIIDDYYKPVIEGDTIVGVTVNGVYQEVPDHLTIDEEGLVYIHKRHDLGYSEDVIRAVEMYREPKTYDVINMQSEGICFLALYKHDSGIHELRECGLFEEVLVINKVDFSKDLKLNIDQLRGHFIEHIKLYGKQK